jgi:hypothetical protein
LRIKKSGKRNTAVCGKTQMTERRKLKRYETSISLSMRLSGVFTRPLTVNVRSRNVSFEGLSIELYKEDETLDLIPYLVLDGKAVELEIKVPPKGERIRATGRVVWCNSGSKKASYYFRAGISIEEIETEDRKKWENFVKKMAQVQDKR